jgi:hypothetical protein
VNWRKKLRSRILQRPVDKLPANGPQEPAFEGIWRLADAEDTTASDTPARYIELALAEGFFIASRFDAAERAGNTETLWALNERYTPGFLLTVVSTSTEVLDASLHYNLHRTQQACSRLRSLNTPRLRLANHLHQGDV